MDTDWGDQADWNFFGAQYSQISFRFLCGKNPFRSLYSQDFSRFLCAQNFCVARIFQNFRVVSQV